MATKDFANLVSGTKVAEGTYKKLNRADVVTAEQGETFSTVFRPGQTKSDFLIGEFKPDAANFDPIDVYNEFLLYKEFGSNGFSPKIHSVISNGKENSLPVFLAHIHGEQNAQEHINPGTKFLIEKKECEKLIFNYFTRSDKITIDYTNFFTSLREFIEKIVKYGYYNTDIKIPNLCIDPKDEKFIMIDLDPKFVRKIPDKERYPEILNYYVNYMIYQVYIYLTVATKVKVHFIDTGIDSDLTNRPNLYAMMEFIWQKNIESAKKREDELDPIYMLFWYSSQVNNGEYGTRFRRFDNSRQLAEFFDRRVVEAIGRIPVPVPSPPQKKSWISSIMAALGFGKSKKTAKKRKLRTITALNIENVPFSMSKGAVPVMILKRSPRRGTVLNLRRYKKRRNKTRSKK